MAEPRGLTVRGAREHNLQGFDLAIPRGRLTVVTGVSGSGKSSLAFDTLFREGQRRFLETLPAFARQFAGDIARPAVTAVEGLGPAVAVGQRVALGNPRSTVGTLTEVWDLLRLLYARLGRGPGPEPPRRGLFSFNGPEGACPRCQGLGVEDRLDLDLLVADPGRTLREGALRVSTPNGYLMYSQVTLAVLDEVLRAHGGSVDVPWSALGEEARHVVLYGSDRLRVPYGKHPLENRLRWRGITARPRQEGFYRGLVPVMEEILRGKRNDSILRFARSGPCTACAGARLRPEALAVLWRGRRIVDLGAMTAAELAACLEGLAPEPREAPVLAPIRAELLARCRLMAELGLDYLAFQRPAPTLSPGEAQRLRLLGLALGELRGLLVVLDEPSAGLHPQDVGRLVQVLRRLRDQGQTVLAVDHDPAVVRAADWLVDLGPGPGLQGGRLLWSGPPPPLGDTPTAAWLARPGGPVRRQPRAGSGTLRLEGLERNNLRGIAVDLKLAALNVVTGVSGAGKTSLLEAVAARLGDGGHFTRLVSVDAAPIGRTPRSSPATYTGALDLVRDLFAATPEAKALGLGKGHFSCNTAGGRCETCEGAGVVEVGMRHLGRLDLVCDACAGRRFHPDVLSVRCRGRSVADLLEGSVAEAAQCFHDHPGLSRILGALMDCGLGHLPLGQPATTLSGGEAQRVKLATELARTGAPGARKAGARLPAAGMPGGALIALDEPTTGLHAADVAVLLRAWDSLMAAGHTLLVVDNDLDVVRAADRVIDLGPGSGPQGGRVVAAGTPAQVAACAGSATGRYLSGADGEPVGAESMPAPAGEEPPIELFGVTTHNLQGLDLALPAQGITVVTGPSGSGKSSLVFDTLLAEAQNRFADLVSPWARRLLPRRGGAELASARGLRAAVAVSQLGGRRNPRSRMGTVSELDQILRLLFARGGTRACPACGAAVQGQRCGCGHLLEPLWAASFSPNAQAGACPRCNGLGFIQACDPERLVRHPERPLGAGAMDGTRFGAYLGERDGRHLAVLDAVGRELGLDFSRPWRDLGAREREAAMDGCGERVFRVAWHYKRGRTEGVHQLATRWVGFKALVDQEYERTHGDPKGEALEPMLSERTCPDCAGERLSPGSRAVTCGGRRLPELAAMAVTGLLDWLERGPGADAGGRAGAELRALLVRRLRALDQAGLGHLAPGREMATLSGGEAQRVRLAAALGGGLSGVCYILDEPTRSLHARDTARLGDLLRELADAGNAVVVVEHDPGLIARADRVLELGPGAGPGGGRLVAAGTPAELRRDGASRAGRLMRGRPAETGGPGLPPRPGVNVQTPLRGVNAQTPLRGVRVYGAALHNLRGIDVDFPAGAVVAVTGVSGSGKSTLVQGVLAASLRARLQGRDPVGCAALDLHLPIQEVLALDQAGPAPGGSGTVATLAGVAEPLRSRLAATPRARALGLAPRHFGSAQPGGRCEACGGRGVVTVAMDLLPDVTVGCEECQGQRFRPEVLECRVEGLDITGLLDATVQELALRFQADPAVAGPLRALAEIGLDYLRLGQEHAALSAGERQRIRLAALLARAGDRPAAVLLDEPTRGLGAEDVDRLRAALGVLARAGHLVVAVEHDLGFIAQADWVIDLGPEGGPGGGTVVAQGAVPAVAAGAGHTARALARFTRLETVGPLEA
jgi:excinuclease ABC subunit A